MRYLPRVSVVFKAGVAVTALVAVAIGTMWEGIVATGPVIGVEKYEVDLGAITYGAPVTHSFRVSNQGGRPLALMQVETTCACTAGILTRLIAPGESGDVTLGADTLGFARRIPQRIAATVTTNDPDRSPVEFVVKFVLEPEFDVSVPQFRFQRGDQNELESRIEIAGGAPVEMLEVSATTPLIGVRLLPPSKLNGAYRVRAKLLEPVAGGFVGVVVVATSSAYVPTIRLPVTVEGA